MASTGKIVKIVREKDKTFSVLSSVSGRQKKETLEEVIELLRTEYTEE